MRLLIFILAPCCLAPGFSNTIFAGSLLAQQPVHASRLEANFQQTHYLPALTNPLITKGTLQIDKSGFTWQVNSPYQYTYRMHDGTMTEIGPDGHKKVLTAEQAPWIIP
ncbi:MAG TPA: hypothetical protein VFP95_07065, partial [Gammaproteobacteria bacterium]|nr:hypothetical protein [Gammaproteobacteria bacterium]